MHGTTSVFEVLHDDHGSIGVIRCATRPASGRVVRHLASRGIRVVRLTRVVVPSRLADRWVYTDAPGGS